MALKTASLVFAAAAAAGAQESAVDRYLTSLAKAAWEERAAQVTRLKTSDDVAKRQAYIRARFLESIGGFPERTPLRPRITGTLARDGYRIEKLIYESLPNYYVTANLYVPRGSGPFPAVLGVSGHSVEGKANELYQRAWIGMARRGFLVLAYDPPGQGERENVFGSGGTAEHTLHGTQCLITGTNIARYELWDGVRAVDYLLTRPEVDPKRIAVAGNSGGGTQSAYLAVVEPRLAVAAPSCYITSWEKLWTGPGPQDAEQNLVGFLHDRLDFGDYLIAFAPRPIMMLTAIRDFFPIDGARATYAGTRGVFSLMGAEERLGYFEYDDQHGWSKPRREATYRWLEKWLHEREDSGAEGEFQTEPPAALNCTETGKVATALGGETVQSLNRTMAEKLNAARPAQHANSIVPLLEAILTRLAIRGERGDAPEVTRGETVKALGYTRYPVEIATEPGVHISAQIMMPTTGQKKKPALLYLEKGAKFESGAWETLVRAGYVVMIPQPRGWDIPPKARRGGYGEEWQTAMRALLVGKTLIGMQVHDVLRAYDYLRTRQEVDTRRIGIRSVGNASAVAMYAAALESGIRGVRCAGPLPSYLGIARAKEPENVISLIAPGVLRDFDLPDLARILGVADQCRE